ncbi:MAG: amidohydrolase [Pseudomonadota bacterium]|nr:amidohydrolase [Pseudomonadota bacterium]
MRDLRLTLVQPNTHWQTPLTNHRLLEGMIEKSGKESDLIVLPEMFTTGFTMDASSNSEEMNGATHAWLIEMANKYSSHICGSIIIQNKGKFFNRLLWVSPDGEHQSYDKRHLFRMANEQKYYSSGDKKLIIQIDQWRICPLICYDLRFPVWSRNRDDYDLLIYVANWPAPRQSAWRSLLPARAVENLCYSVGVNRVGTDGNKVEYLGDSMVADYFGNIVLDANNKEGVFNTKISLEKLRLYREKFPAWKDADNFTLLNTAN